MHREKYIKDIGQMEKETGLENNIILMAMFMMENGKMANRTERQSFIIKMKFILREYTSTAGCIKGKGPKEKMGRLYAYNKDCFLDYIILFIIFFCDFGLILLFICHTPSKFVFALHMVL
jgi:hypothetical protein